jgi:hypothetical protein
MSTEWIQNDVKNSSRSSGFTLTPSSIQTHTELSIASDDVNLSVEWTKQRNVIPDFLAAHGISLEFWQQLFDRVNDIWISQMKSIAMDQYRMDTIGWYHRLSIGVFVCSFLFVCYVIFLRFTTDTNLQSEQNLDILTHISVSLFIMAHCFFRGVQCYRIRIISQFAANKHSIEKDASDLMLFLSNEKLKQHKLAVEAMRKKLEVKS